MLDKNFYFILFHHYSPSMSGAIVGAAVLHIHKHCLTFMTIVRSIELIGLMVAISTRPIQSPVLVVVDFVVVVIGVITITIIVCASTGSASAATGSMSAASFTTVFASYSTVALSAATIVETITAIIANTTTVVSAPSAVALAVTPAFDPVPVSVILSVSGTVVVNVIVCNLCGHLFYDRHHGQY